MSWSRWILGRTICKLIGHSKETQLQWRFRHNKVNKLNRKGGKRRPDARYVLGQYEVCKRCNKKLSNFKRIA